MWLEQYIYRAQKKFTYLTSWYTTTYNEWRNLLKTNFLTPKRKCANLYNRLVVIVNYNQFTPTQRPLVTKKEKTEKELTDYTAKEVAEQEPADEKALIKPKKRRDYSKIVRWRPVHNEVLILVAKGHTEAEVAKKTGLAPTTVNWLKGTDKFKQKMKTVQQKVKERVEREITAKLSSDDVIAKSTKYLFNSMSEAAQKIVAIMRKGTSKDRIQLDAANRILELCGFTRRSDNSHERQYSPEEVERAASTINELMKLTERISDQGSRFVLRNPNKGKHEAE